MTIEKYLNRWLTLSGLEPEDFSLDIEEAEDNSHININIPEDKAGFYIGARGETLDAIQQIVRISFREEEKKVTIDINCYKQQREQALLEKVERIANELLENGRRFVFSNLNSYERFLIHSFISGDERFNESLETFSEDEEFGRVLILQAK